MRGSILAIAVACAILSAGTMIVGRADATTLAGQGLRPAIESVNPAGGIACRHHPRSARVAHCHAPRLGHEVRHVAPLVDNTPAPQYPPTYPNQQRYFSRW
jgi:hypothetical protein